MKNVFVIGLAAVLTYLAGCSAKEQLYESLYEGLKMGQELRQPTEEQDLVGDEELPDYHQYKKERQVILKKGQ